MPAESHRITFEFLGPQIECDRASAPPLPVPTCLPFGFIFLPLGTVALPGSLPPSAAVGNRKRFIYDAAPEKSA